MNRTNVQFITKSNGHPEWAIIPYTQYLHFQDLENIAYDVQTFKKALTCHEEELIPEEYANRLINGENPIKVWREYRHITQTGLSKMVKLSKPYLSQLESGKRQASIETLKKIADSLGIIVDDLI